MKRMGGRKYQLWDEQDGFFYDVLRHPDGSFEKFRVRSLVGLIPLYAVERLEEQWIEPFAEFKSNFKWFLNNKRHIVQDVCFVVNQGGKRVHICAVVDEDQMKGLLRRVLDPEEFLSPWGLRSLSRHHAAHPFHFGERDVRYEPAEASSKIKGGNSNWRGPVWFPTSFLMIESLRKLGHLAYAVGRRRPRRLEGRADHQRRTAAAQGPVRPGILRSAATAAAGRAGR